MITSRNSHRARPEHHFRTSLAISDSYRGAGWWIPVYQRAFPRLESAVAVKDDGWAQRGGIDRLVTLSCGRTFSIDEKVRLHEWPDILLEQWSDEARRIPGWVQKPLACDFIAYAFAPTGVCYLLPVPALQRAWRMFGRDWIKHYGKRRAYNPGYVSVSVPVPKTELIWAIAQAMIVDPKPARQASGDKVSAG